MKKAIFTLLLAVFLIGACSAAFVHIRQWEEKLGPPGATKAIDGEIHYYWFYAHKKTNVQLGIVGDSVAGGSGTTTGGWLTVEITTDETGKVTNRQKYWAQPGMVEELLKESQ